MTGLSITVPPSLVWGKSSYKVAVLPEQLPIVIYEKCNPIISHLNQELGVTFELVIPRDYNEHIQIIKEGGVDFSYQNPFVSIELWPHLQPLVITEKGKKWGIESRGIIIAKKDKGITKPDDLIGKRISIVSFQSADGFIAQKILLKGMMINEGTDYTVFETTSNLHTNVIVDVLQGNADAGFLSEELFVQADPANNISDKELKSINIVATTTYIPNWIFCASKKLDPKFANEVKKALLNIPLNSEVTKAAQIRRFVQLPSNYLEEYRSRIQ
jgi:phosphate/phosphite/phosphonate ABC transporter binding protein